MSNTSERLLAVIRLMRPQFLLAYIIIGLGGIIIGFSQDLELTSKSLSIIAFLPILIAASGVHYRDEASDWIKGYDKEFGGMGVIREGIFTPESGSNASGISC